MSKVAIVTDSTASIPKEYLEKYHIHVAPQILIWGEENFEDGVNIMPKEFYTRLKTAKVMPASSQATPKYFHKLFGDLLLQDYQVLAILISSKLSGTVTSAVQAKEFFPDAPIEIIDSYSTAMAMGFQILEVARAIENGATLKECMALAEKTRQHTGVVFAVDTLEFLHRGGRIGGATRFLGTALKLKPILELIDGRVEPIERVRTRTKSLHRLVELAEDRIGDRQPVRLAALHANAEEDAKAILELARERIPSIESFLAEVSPVVGTHAGPGTVALAFMAGM